MSPAKRSRCDPDYDVDSRRATTRVLVATVGTHTCDRHVGDRRVRCQPRGFYLRAAATLAPVTPPTKSGP